jgi:hypothetical protein
MLLALVEKYRESLFDIPSPACGGGLGRGHDILEQISLHLLRALCPEAEPHWQKAQAIIAKHRKRYGKKWNGWMSFKLLAGVS